METQVEERLTFVEARIDEHAKAIEEIKLLILNLDQKFDRRIDAFEQRIDRRFEAIDRRFEAIDRRFEAIDRRFETIDRRFEAIDRRFEAIDMRINVLDQKFSKYFLWIIGIQVSVLLAIVASLLR